MKKIIIITILITFFSCNNDKSDCPIEIPCTEEFRTITIKIKNSNSNPISLDRFEVLIIDSGIDITREVTPTEFEIMKKSGTYPLFDDGHRQYFKGRSELHLNFKGFIDNEEVANEDFIVDSDCCHINLVDGVTDIIID